MKKVKLPPISRKQIGVALAGVLVVGAVAMLRSSSSSSSSSSGKMTEVAQAAVEPFAISAWPAGVTRTYRAEFRSNNMLTLRSGERSTLAGKIEVDGDLVLRSFGSESGQIVLSVEWSAVKHAKVEAFEHSLTPTAAEELRAAVAVLHVDTDGRLASIGIVPDATPLARHVQRAVLTELASVLEGAWGKRDVIDTSIGRAQVKRMSSPAGTFTRTGYADIDSIGQPSALESKVEASGEGRLDRAGILQHALCNEKVNAVSAAEENPIERATSELHVELTLVSSALQKPTTLPETKPESIRPMQPVSGEDQRAASLERRASGVTAETVFGDVRMAALLPNSALETEWVWHDSAWLELHPDEAAPLLERAERELPLSGIAAAFDVVVISGTTRAQSALLESLDRLRKTPSSDRAFVTMLDHIAQLRAPTPEVFAFVSVEYAQATTKDRRRSSAYALGALSRRSIEFRDQAAAVGGDVPACKGVECAAEHSLLTLERDLDKVADAEDRAMLLRALGNGGQTSSFKSVSKHATSETTDVRRAVAAALRNMEGGPVIDLLLKLAADREGDVASEALQSLFRKSLDTTDYDTLERLVSLPTFPEEAHLPLINGLVHRLSETPKASSVLTALMNVPTLHPKLKMQIEGILRAG